MKNKIWISLILLVVIGCGSGKGTSTSTSLENNPQSVPVSIDDTGKDLGQLREDLSKALTRIRTAAKALGDWIAKQPQTKATEAARADLQAIGEATAQAEQTATGIEKQEVKIEAEAVAVAVVVEENQVLKKDSTKWLNWTLLPAGCIGLIAAAVVASLGLGWIAKAIAAGGAVAVALALFLPALQGISIALAWSVAAVLFLYVVWLLWCSRKAVGELVTGTEALKEDISATVKAKWFDNKTPISSVFQSDTTQKLVKAVKRKR